jgi:hypothetical protein
LYPGASPGVAQISVSLRVSEPGCFGARNDQGGDGALNLYKYNYPDQRRVKDKDDKPLGVVRAPPRSLWSRLFAVA